MFQIFLLNFSAILVIDSLTMLLTSKLRLDIHMEKKRILDNLLGCPLSGSFLTCLIANRALANRDPSVVGSLRRVQICYTEWNFATKSYLKSQKIYFIIHIRYDLQPSSCL